MLMKFAYEIPLLSRTQAKLIYVKGEKSSIFTAYNINLAQLVQTGSYQLWNMRNDSFIICAV